MSRIFQGADAAAATRISGLGALGGLGGGGSFAPRVGLDDPAFDAMPFGYSGNGLGGPEQALDIDAVREEAFARGFDEGAAASEAAMAELSARQDALTQALAALKAPASGTLAAMLSTAVVRLVEQIVGNAPIDADLLRRRCESVAACMEDNDGDVTLRVHPDELLGPVWRRDAMIDFNGSVMRSREFFFVHRTTRFEPSAAGRTALERRYIHGHRWCDAADIANLARAGQTVYPLQLGELLDTAQRLTGAPETWVVPAEPQAIR